MTGDVTWMWLVVAGLVGFGNGYLLGRTHELKKWVAPLLESAEHKAIEDRRDVPGDAPRHRS